MEIVHSPTFNKEYLIGDNTSKVDAYCPIDGTQLVSMQEYDFSEYACIACGAGYTWGNHDVSSLQKQALEYATEIQRTVERKSKEIVKLEQIVLAAKQNKIL
jgi:dissimilatory sulfite reductase (desulfoviridin) alpha/beta subunit